MIGGLLRLIRTAAIEAVLDGSECTTRASLEEIEVHVAANDHQAAVSCAAVRGYVARAH